LLWFVERFNHGDGIVEAACRKHCQSQTLLEAGQLLVARGAGASLANVGFQSFGQLVLQPLNASLAIGC